ncbi:MAG: recombination regulator RecX [Bacteroidales bacterium]|jgi:regulatory protein|nr:recombination regulator RecX [Bacteroidales bacterium]
MDSKIYNKIMRWCARKEYSRQDILQKLVHLGYSHEDASTIVALLVENNFIDDYRYAKACANDKFHHNKWGYRKIACMLKMHGIEDPVILEALESIGADEYMQLLRKELKKKRKTIKTGTPEEIRAKLHRFATGRGFDSDIVYLAMIDLE